jgi:hypothetical protein
MLRQRNIQAPPAAVANPFCVVGRIWPEARLLARGQWRTCVLGCNCRHDRAPLCHEPPVAATISGIDSVGVLHQNLEVARGFLPFNTAAMQTIREARRVDASDGHMELFKTTKKYDGDLGREMHGFPSSAELPV